MTTCKGAEIDSINKARNKNSSIINKDLTEIKKAYAEFMAAQIECINSQCLLYSLQNLSRTSNLPENVIDKVNNIFLRADIESGRYKAIFNDNDLENGSEKLTECEKIALKGHVKVMISKSVDNYKKKAAIYSGLQMLKCIETDIAPLNESKIEILNVHEIFNEKYGKYNSLLEEYDTLLKTFVKCWVNRRTKQLSAQFGNLVESAEEIYLKTRLQNLDKKTDILKTNHKISEDLVQLETVLAEKEFKTQTELNRLQSEVRQYESLDKTEFPSLVKQCATYKTQYSHLESIYSSLQISDSLTWSG